MAHRPRYIDETMEAPTPFDLNRAIQLWRENLSQSPALRAENLNELESHLRDSIETLQTRGLSVEEAFLIATRRIGSSGVLENEFAKVNRRAVWLDRSLWMLIGIQIWGLVTLLAYGVGRTGMSWAWASLHLNARESGMVLPVACFSLVQALLFGGSLVFCWWLVVRKGERLGARLAPLLRRRSTLVALVLGLFLISIFVYTLNLAARMVQVRLLSLANLGSTALYFAYAYWITWPVQTVAMIALIVLLARKRLTVSPA